MGAGAGVAAELVVGTGAGVVAGVSALLRLRFVFLVAGTGAVVSTAGAVAGVATGVAADAAGAGATGAGATTAGVVAGAGATGAAVSAEVGAAGTLTAGGTAGCCPAAALARAFIVSACSVMSNHWSTV